MRMLTLWTALILSTILMGCSSSVDVLPLVKSVTVIDGRVSVVAFPTSAPAQLDGKVVANDAPIQMHPGQVLQLTDAAQVCSYKLVKLNGDTAQFRQTTSIRQPSGRWQHEELPVAVTKFAGLSSSDQNTQLPPSQ